MDANLERALVFGHKARELVEKGHYARAAEKYSDAIAAAQRAFPASEDSLVVTYLQAQQADALIRGRATPGVPTPVADAAAWGTLRTLLLETTIPSLMRRRAARTLLPGTCRADEVAWYRAEAGRSAEVHVHDRQERGLFLTTLAPFIGYSAYLTAALTCLKILAVLPLQIHAEETAALVRFVASAGDLMCELRTLLRQSFAPAEQRFIFSLKLFLGRTSESRDAYCESKIGRDNTLVLAEAHARLQRSGVISERRIDVEEITPFLQGVVAHGREVEEALQAESHALRSCALAACGAREAHASHFKLCAACKTVAYCCKAHQADDWPAHKAACKAARKKTQAEREDAGGAGGSARTT
jgi:hypothetical protein